MSAARRSLRVLIVDDEPAVADTLVLIVSKSGHDAVAAYDGVGAMAAAQEISPDVVLSDVMMPGLNGFELVRHMAEQYPACKVLLMSGFEGAAEIAQRVQPGRHFMNVLIKPVLPQTILSFISSCANNPAAAVELARSAAG